MRVRFDAFELDEANARLTRNGQPIALPPRAFAVLCTLARQPGQLVTKNDLLDAVWGHQHVSESALKNIVSEVRAALTDDARQPRYIETASRFGYRFIGMSPSASPAPVVASLQPQINPSIVGREAALGQLRAAWQRALGHQRQLVWVVGEAGIGKTTLIETFANELPPKTAAFGRCIEHYGSGEPYLPVLEVMREISRQEPALAELIRAIAPTWRMQMPWLCTDAERAALHRELAGVHPDRMMREMRELMDRFAPQRPFVFIMEDMHWSDLATLRMMEHFGRRPPNVPVLWIASFRLTQIIAENHPLRELRHELKLHRLVEEILLDPFSEAQLGDYLTTRLPHARFSEAFVQQLHDHTEGLPLFVANVADALVTQASDDPQALARWAEPSQTASFPVPDSLAGMFEKQLLRLPAETQAVLEAASVCGSTFRASIVAEMLGRSPDAVRESCDELVRKQMWLRHVSIVELPDDAFDSSYGFLHALYQHALYQRLTQTQRVSLHRRAARALSQDRAIGATLAPAALASHYERGHQTLLAVQSYSTAAGLALQHFSPKDAEQLADHALTLIERCAPGVERQEVELALRSHAGLAASQLHGIASEQARSAFAAVRQLCDAMPQTPARALTLNGLGWMFYVRGEFDEAVELGKRLEEIAASHGNDAVLTALACNLSGVAQLNQGKLLHGCAQLERGIELSRAIDAAATRAAFVIDPEVSMRMNIAFPLVARGRADQARKHLALGAERAQRLGQPMGLMLMDWAGGMTYARLAEYEAVARHAASLTKFIDATLLQQGRGPALWLTGLAQSHAGDPAGGAKLIMQGYEFHARLGMYAGCPEVLGYAADAYLRAGDLDAATQVLDQAIALGERIGERLVLPDLLSVRGRIALARQDVAAARSWLQSASAEAAAQGAAGLALNILILLAELPDRAASDIAALDAAHKNVKEGFDTKAYRRAAAILAIA